MIAATWADFLASDFWQLILMVLLLGASGFFSGTETALFNLSAGQLKRLVGGGAAGRLIARLMRRPSRVLNTILLGNMLVNVGYASVATVTILHLGPSGYGLLPAWAAAPVSLAPLVLLILLGEVTPKMLALVVGERWALLAVGPLAVCERVVRPMLRVVDAVIVTPLTRILAPHPHKGADVTADELAALLDLSAKRGLLDQDASALLREIVELSDLKVADIMVPRVDMIAFDLSEPPEKLLELFRETRLRKLPVYEGDLDHVHGVIHAKRVLLNPAADLRRLIVPVPFIPETGTAERALLQFRVTRTQMAIVVDEYGGTAGLVTLEDVLEEIVGDIPDPAGAERGAAVERVAPGEYRIDGDLGIHEWADAFQFDLAGRRISTIGGFVTSLLGRIPRVGDTATHRNIAFTVETMRRRRIGSLRVRLEGGSQ